mgnify:CR=1 FL=1
MKIEYIQAIGVFFAVVGLFVNAYYSRRRLIHDERSRNVAATESLLTQWTSKEMREGVEYILSSSWKEHDPKGGLSGLPSDIFPKVNHVTHICDRISARVIYGEADFSAVSTLIGSKMVELWKKLEPFIQAERSNPKTTTPDLRCFFEAVACSFDQLDLPQERKKIVQVFAKKHGV